MKKPGWGPGKRKTGLTGRAAAQRGSGPAYPHTITIQLSTPELDELNTLADTIEVSRSEVLRRALALFARHSA